MNSAEQVARDIEQIKASGISMSEAVWKTALDCVDWGYVFGAWGEECTPANRKRRSRDDHPTIVSKCQVLNGSKDTCAKCKWFPNGETTRIFDCRGFTDWCLKQFGIDLQGEGATSQWGTASNWSEKGEIKNVPYNTLVCLFVKKGSKMEHTGFGYRGETCECSAGVQHFTARNKKWTHYAIPRGIEKGVDPVIPTDEKPTLRKGDKGEYVTLAQTKLLAKGYDIGAYGADGKFGNATENAVKAFQRENLDQNGNPLVADGVIGQKTWWALDNTETVFYTVTIPHMTKYQAEGIVKAYLGAYMTEERG